MYSYQIEIMYKFSRFFSIYFGAFLRFWDWEFKYQMPETANLSRVKAFAGLPIRGNGATSVEHMDALPITELSQSECRV